MTNPYQVLGISPTASDEEVKTAYRDLARKYHPDNYQGNPLSDLATRKMQEINEAYDTIMADRRGGGNGGGARGQNGGAHGQAGGGGNSQFADIRRLINGGRVTEAEELLDGVPKHARDAEWYFLKGSVYYTRGWLDDAYECFAQASGMDPGNREYGAALNQLNWQRQTGRVPRSQSYGGGSCSVCDMCAGLMCADCCCECMGGDLCSCC